MAYRNSQVDVRVVADTVDILAEGELIRTHRARPDPQKEYGGYASPGDAIDSQIDPPRPGRRKCLDRLVLLRRLPTATCLITHVYIDMSFFTCILRWHANLRPTEGEIMLEFDAGPFLEIASTPLGSALWGFLQEKEMLIRLETATYLKRPALEAVQEQLLERFGDEIRGDRWKQMIGRMTRQVMEAHGYLLDQTGVRIGGGGLFTSAARYVKRGK